MTQVCSGTAFTLPNLEKNVSLIPVTISRGVLHFFFFFLCNGEQPRLNENATHRTAMGSFAGGNYGTISTGYYQNVSLKNGGALSMLKDRVPESVQTFIRRLLLNFQALRNK